MDPVWTYLPSAVSINLAEISFLVILKMRLAKVVVAVIAMPSRQGVADHALADRLVVIEILPRFCRWFLRFDLWFHVLCLKKIPSRKIAHSLVYLKRVPDLGSRFVQQARYAILLFKFSLKQRHVGKHEKLAQHSECPS